MKTDNELIAEFMGFERDYDKSPLSVPDYVHYKKRSTAESMFVLNMRYDTSWDWLMPVVESIEGVEEPAAADPQKGTIWPYQVEILSRSTVQIIDNRTDEAIVTIDNQKGKLSKIESVYQAVVAFIKWYNSQSKPEN